ncbi:PAS domain S-box protein [Paenibacillus sp. PK3_47]|uniref:EAL domain-containing protein n=1 Tax=Paenibacillus sp. PK3_47 TaxID=2072642 RepID=UPI00201DFDF1|nr:EAL domain-containing protein [Paenibacillus sp. PK3_47]UQZ36751.1 PAS domain S-box protein [Paenibacillus sp. PK3_47]
MSNDNPDELEPQHPAYLPPTEIILDNITNGFFILDHDWCITYTNKPMQNFVRMSREELLGKSILDVLPDAVGGDFQEHYKKAMNEKVPVLFEAYYERTGEWLEVRVVPSEEGLIGYAFNITERKQQEQTIEHMVYHDYLTGLPNRRALENKLDETVRQAGEDQESFALFYMDIDRFKNLQDTVGHQLGDLLIKQLAGRLAQQIADKGYIARLGGDEFAVIVDRTFSDPDKINEIAGSLLAAIEENPFEIMNHELFITGSLGISFYPEHGQDADLLLKNADIALYRSKKNGRNQHTTYNPVVDINSYKKLSLEKDLRLAIYGDMLELYYQPRVEAATGKIRGAEALIRWDHPEWGVLSPTEFISIAEETGLIIPLTEWVIQTVCRQIKSWQEEGRPAVPVSVNVAVQFFLSKTFIHKVKGILAEHETGGGWLEFELTETSIKDNEKLVISVVAELREMGIKVSLDDYGTGYLSLAYLAQCKMDILKIDKGFIRNLTTERSNTVIVASVIQLAHGLGMKVVAEGVETAEQLSFLKKNGCDEIQGYLFSRPAAVADFSDLLMQKVLTPGGTSSPGVTEDRRRHIRIPLLLPLSAQMTIVKIKDRRLSLGMTEVVVEDIGAGGLRFLTHLALTVNKDIVLQLETEILGENVQLSGTVVWKQEADEEIYQYGFEFIMNDRERLQLERLLGNLTEEMEKSPILPRCRLIKTNKYKYVKNIAAQLHLK